jgi:hypothetical protein
VKPNVAHKIFWIFPPVFIVLIWAATLQKIEFHRYHQILIIINQCNVNTPISPQILCI